MERNQPTLMIKIITTATFLAMVIANALANALPINGLTTGQISDFYPNLFAPAGWTFAIWGLIYLLLADIHCTSLEFFRTILILQGVNS